MSDNICPSQVHYLSNFVYRADLAYRNPSLWTPGRSHTSIHKEAEDFLAKSLVGNGLIDVNNFSLFTATSGMFQINLLSGFGFVAEGIAGRQGELILVTRGTNFEHNKHDLATDANIGFAIGPRGHIVHRGFLKTFLGYRDQLVNFITDGRRRNHIRTIHCMGHSLGGALANLNASALRSAGFDVHLYTIGCPRVGIFGFAYDTTKIISADKICRVINPCDPVPMVPVFPFIHASRGESEFLIKASDKIGIDQHLLSSGYARMSSFIAWSDFIAPNPLDVTNQGELGSELEKVGGGTMFSGTALGIISNAMTQLLKLAGLVTLSSMQTSLGLTFTVVDMIAEALAKAAHSSVMVTEQVTSIVHGLLGFLGRAFIEVKDLTFSFLRWVLGLFAQEMNSRAALAMDRARQS
jgi:triacylglycerol lipase